MLVIILSASFQGSESTRREASGNELEGPRKKLSPIYVRESPNGSFPTLGRSFPTEHHKENRYFVQDSLMAIKWLFIGDLSLAFLRGHLTPMGYAKAKVGIIAYGVDMGVSMLRVLQLCKGKPQLTTAILEVSPKRTHPKKRQHIWAPSKWPASLFPSSTG